MIKNIPLIYTFLILTRISIVCLSLRVANLAVRVLPNDQCLVYVWCVFQILESVWVFRESLVLEACLVAAFEGFEGVTLSCGFLSTRLCILKFALSIEMLKLLVQSGVVIKA